MRTTSALLCILLLGSSTIRAEDAPKPPSRPLTADQAATAAAAALAASDDAALAALAGQDTPDPWLVADALIHRGEFDAAASFAKAAPRADTAKLSPYVQAQRTRKPDPKAREQLLQFDELVRKKRFEQALALIGARATPMADVVGLEVGQRRARVLATLERPLEGAAELLRVAAAAEPMGRLSLACRIYGQLATLARRLRRFDDATRAIKKHLDLCKQRADEIAAGRGLREFGKIKVDQGDLEGAIKLFEQAIAQQKKTDDRGYMARTHTSLGTALLTGGRLAEAERAYTRAVELHRAVDDRRRAAGGMINLGNVLHQQQKYEQALEAYKPALQFAEETGNHRLVAALHVNLGALHAERGQTTEALASYARARELFDRLRRPGDVAAVQTNVGAIHVRLGNTDQAMRILEAALRVHRARGRRSHEAQTLESMADVYARRGQFGKALDALEAAERIYAALGARPLQGAILRKLGDRQRFLGNFPVARSCFERALAIATDLGDRESEAETTGLLGVLALSMGEPEQAIATLERAETLGQAPLRWDTAIALAHCRLGAPENALALLQRALPTMKARGETVVLGSVHRTMAHAFLDLGRVTEARAAFERALAIAEEHDNRAAIASTLTGLASTLIQLGEPQKALEACRRAVTLTNLMSSGLSEAAALSFREAYQGAFEVALHASRDAKDLGQLAWFAEQGRAGVLRQALGSQDALEKAVMPPAMQAELRAARRAEADAVAGYRKAVRRKDRRAAKQSVLAARDGLAATIARVERTSKAAATIVLGVTDDLATIQSRLETGDTLVLYGMSGDTTGAVVIRRETARLVELGGTEDLEQLIRRLNLEDIDSDPAAAIEKLRGAIAEPLAIGADVKRLLISPLGRLGYVPFALLFPAQEVVYVPSGTTYGLLRAQGAKRGDAVLALGAPDYGTARRMRRSRQRGGIATRLTPLPATRIEVEHVGTVKLLGEDASESNLAAQLKTRPRWRSLHLACHGLVDPQRPYFSALALTADGEGDGFLTALEIFRMKIPADLVVMSACETAKGKLYRTEGIVGLTRAFMFAGAPRVIASLWKVDDKATQALMVKFYELWNPADGSKGLGTAAALRQAQAFIKAQDKWKHPYYWAAWVLWGLPD